LAFVKQVLGFGLNMPDIVLSTLPVLVAMSRKRLA